MVGFGGSRGNRRRAHTGLVGEDTTRHTVANHGTDGTTGHGLAGKGIAENQANRIAEQMGIVDNDGQAAQYIEYRHNRHNDGRGFGNTFNAAQYHNAGEHGEHHAGNPAVNAEAGVYGLRH